MRPRFLAAGLCILGALCFAAPADAKDDSPDALFDQGIAHLEAGRFDQACPLIERSYKLDPLAGTLFALAECEAKRGRLATAVARYNDYLALYAKLPRESKARQGDREQVSRSQLMALGPTVPEIVLALPQGAPTGVTATLDGAAAAISRAIRVDPGEHVIGTMMPGETATTETRVKLDKGEHKRVELPVQMKTAATPAVVPHQEIAPAPAPAEPPPTSGRRTAPYAAAGVGVAGILVGGITGGLALGKKGTVSDNCGIGGVPEACNHDGKAASDSLKTLGLVSTIGFGVGIAGAATAVVLLVTEPKKKDAAITRRGVMPDVIAGRDGALLGVRGGF